MNQVAIENHVLSIAEEILSECKKIPAYVDAKECKKKRELRAKLRILEALSFELECSAETTALIHSATVAWLETGIVIESLPRHKDPENGSTKEYLHAFVVNDQHALTLTTKHDIFMNDAFIAGMGFLISLQNFPKNS